MFGIVFVIGVNFPTFGTRELAFYDLFAILLGDLEVEAASCTPGTPEFPLDELSTFRPFKRVCE